MRTRMDGGGLRPSQKHPLFTRGPLVALLLSSLVCGSVASRASYGAGIPVIDVALNTVFTTSQIETMARWVTQGAQMARTIGQGAEVIRQGGEMIGQGVRLYQNFTDPTFLQNYAMNLVRAEVRKPLPNETNVVRDAISGALGVEFTRFTGLGDLASEFIGRNMVYRPEGQDDRAVRLREEASSNAARHAIAYRSYDSTAQRIDGMEVLASQIGRGMSMGARQDLANRIAIENGYAMVHNNQLLAARIAMEADDARQRQKVEQLRRKSSDETVAWADSVIARRGGGGGGMGGSTAASVVESLIP